MKTRQPIGRWLTRYASGTGKWTRQSDRRAPEARRREAESEAARALADPSAPLRERLGEIEARLPDLRRMHRQQGDALAGRLLGTLERERSEIMAKLGTG